MYGVKCTQLLQCVWIEKMEGNEGKEFERTKDHRITKKRERTWRGGFGGKT